ncbi:MAG: hypothetical protein CM1200mP29_08530 [Verrucomicrobiota bacterium]|nr:MAG: hypothetical protein CM1200mP29_08530 [Verrucomicrobiota bacterium]
MYITFAKTSSSHPHAKAVCVVVASYLVPFGQAIAELDHRQPAHLAAPVHDGAVEQTAFLQVANQRRRRFVDFNTAIGRAVLIEPWWSQTWLWQRICTNRTPRSTSRRAIRQRVP